MIHMHTHKQTRIQLVCHENLHQPRGLIHEKQSSHSLATVALKFDVADSLERLKLIANPFYLLRISFTIFFCAVCFLFSTSGAVCQSSEPKMNPNEFEQINSITLLNVWRAPNTADSLIVLFFILGENHLRINGSEIALTVQYFHVDMGMLLEALVSVRAF